MSNINKLVSDMKAIFGESFGQDQPAVSNLEEAISSSLKEAWGSAKPKLGGLMFPKDKVDKKKGHMAFLNRQKKANKTVDSFRADADARDKELKAKRAPATPSARALPRAVAGSKVAHRTRTQNVHGGSVAGSKGKSHNPFKHSPNLGLGPGDPPNADDGGERHHDQAKCWNCDCGDIYTQGCKCVGTGASKDCPQGKVKKVKIKKSYRTKYNRMYHAWRDKKRGSSDGVTARNSERGAR